MKNNTRRKIKKQILHLLSDGKPHQRNKIIKYIIKINKYSQEELNKKTSTGKSAIEANIDYIISDLKRNGYTTIVSRGKHSITSKGKKYLNTEIYPKTYKDNLTSNTTNEKSVKLNEELLNHVKKTNPHTFEKTVTTLISKMGYGKITFTTNKTKDNGIDGIISEDPLELHNTYVQAKRWNKTKIGVKEIREFKGALNDKNANTGVLITTSTFTDDAVKSAKKSNIKLINGQELSELLIKYQIGIKTRISYIIDSGYFS